MKKQLRSLMTETTRLAAAAATAIVTISTVLGAQQPAPTTPAGRARGPAQPQVPAWEAQARVDQNSRLAHEQLLAKRTQGRIDVYFAGDSIVRRWGATDYPQLLANWNDNFRGWNAANFGWGADRTQNILWRLQNGELDDVHPKVIVLLAGTNNVGNRPGEDAKVAEISRGIEAIVTLMRQKAPAATIVVTAILPRNDNIAVMPTINAINANLARLADGRTIRFLNVNDRLAGSDGVLVDGVMNPDGLHPSVKGYQIWADALKPILTELLGPPAATDLAPPPTGDPGASGRGAAPQVRP
jgi:lysophospholipase L1-like esterase